MTHDYHPSKSQPIDATAEIEPSQPSAMIPTMTTKTRQTKEPAPTCTGTTIEGEPCQSPAKLGTDRCGLHTEGKARKQSRRHSTFGHVRPVKGGHQVIPPRSLGVRPRTFKSKSDANAWKAALETSVGRGDWIDPREGKRTVAEVATLWLESNPSKRPNSLATDEITIRIHLAPLANRTILSVKQPEIQALVNQWTTRSMPRTVRRQYGVLAAVFAYAVNSDWLSRTPCRNIRLPAVQPAIHRLPTVTRLTALATATAPRYQAMVWIGAVLGLRWEEVAALRVGSLDLPGRLISVTGTVIRGPHGRPTFHRPKSSTSYRTFDVPQELVQVLTAHLQAHNLSRRSDLLFPAPEGGPLSYANWRRRIWLPAAKSAGCEGIGFHDLRRTTATALVALGVDMKTTGFRLGHSDPRLTIATYAQVTPEADRAAADKLGQYFFGQG